MADGQYRQGVLDAATTVEERTQRKLGSHETGVKLYRRAFGVEAPTPDQPRLRFPGVSKTSAPRERHSRHLGAQLIGAAVTATIRNWAAHTTRPLDAQLGMEYLAVVSLLGRWVEEAEVRVHSATATEAVAQAAKERDTARADLERANQKLRRAAAAARREGQTLAQLAEIIGVSAQAVHKYWASPP